MFQLLEFGFRAGILVLAPELPKPLLLDPIFLGREEKRVGEGMVRGILEKDSGSKKILWFDRKVDHLYGVSEFVAQNLNAWSGTNGSRLEYKGDP